MTASELHDEVNRELWAWFRAALRERDEAREALRRRSEQNHRLHHKHRRETWEECGMTACTEDRAALAGGSA